MFHSYCCLYLVHWLPTPPTLFGCFFALRVFFLPEVHYKSYLTWFGVFDRMVGAGIADKIDKKKPISRWHVLSDYIMLLTRLTCSWLPHAFNSDNMVPSFHYVFEKKKSLSGCFPLVFFRTNARVFAWFAPAQSRSRAGQKGIQRHTIDDPPTQISIT